jgi:hypothetical protein
LCTCLLVFYGKQINATTLDYLPEQTELFRQVLTAAKLTPEDIHFDRADMSLWDGDKYQVKLLDVFFDNPYRNQIIHAGKSITLRKIRLIWTNNGFPLLLPETPGSIKNLMISLL